MASLLKLANLDWDVPYYTTPRRRQKTLSVRIPYRHADGLPNLLMDIEPVSTTSSRETCEGPQVPRDGEWEARKHGLQRCRQWRKVRVAMCHIPEGSMAAF
ncbi:MAG: transposase [Rhodobacter sp.]|nr:transposase [Rhodobacter sp.]MCA3479021.1 transposase [Rhodobacter sp.]